MTTREAIDRVRELGVAFKKGLIRAGKEDFIGDESDLELGLMAYNYLNLQGENQIYDIAYNIVVVIIYKLHTEEGTMH